MSATEPTVIERAYSNGVTRIIQNVSLSEPDGNIVLAGRLYVVGKSAPMGVWTAHRKVSQWRWRLILSVEGHKPLVYKVWSGIGILTKINREYWMHMILWGYI